MTMKLKEIKEKIILFLYKQIKTESEIINHIQNEHGFPTHAMCRRFLAQMKREELIKSPMTLHKYPEKSWTLTKRGKHQGALLSLNKMSKKDFKVLLVKSGWEFPE